MDYKLTYTFSGIDEDGNATGEIVTITCDPDETWNAQIGKRTNISIANESFGEFALTKIEAPKSTETDLLN